MPVFTNWYVVVVLEVAGKERKIQGPRHAQKEKAEADLDELRAAIGSGGWINLGWISANPAHVVAAHLDSTSIGIA